MNNMVYCVISNDDYIKVRFKRIVLTFNTKVQKKRCLFDIDDLSMSVRYLLPTTSKENSKKLELGIKTQYLFSFEVM